MVVYLYIHNKYIYMRGRTSHNSFWHSHTLTFSFHIHTFLLSHTHTFSIHIHTYIHFYSHTHTFSIHIHTYISTLTHTYILHSHTYIHFYSHTHTFSIHIHTYLTFLVSIISCLSRKSLSDQELHVQDLLSSSSQFYNDAIQSHPVFFSSKLLLLLF